MTGGLLLAKLLEEAGLPPGVFNVVIGAGSEIGDALVTHPIPRVISFTGSTPVGRRVGELATKAPIIKRTELELGGNSPFVVLDDADLSHVTDAAIFGKFLHQGQICMAVNRFIVDEKLYDGFVDRFVEKTKALKVGDPAEPDTMIGPIINESQFNKLKERVADARNSGATELVSGEPQGLMFPPHVYADVKNDTRLAQEEIFGPIAPIIRAQGEEDALRIANDTQFGLSGCVFTSDFERGQRFAEKMQTGMAHVNDQPVLDIPNNPFGGEKNSGIGRFNGVWAIEAFTTDQWVSIQHAPHPYPMDSREVHGPWAGGG